MKAATHLGQNNPPTVRVEKVDVLLQVLDEVDYGLVLLDSQGQMQYANHLARHELASGRLLCLAACGIVSGSSAELTDLVMDAVLGAVQGRRRLIYLSRGEHHLPVSVIPLAPGLDAPADSVLLQMARQRVGDNLALQMFARDHSLTPTEEAVLRALCNGHAVEEIAARHRVAESTVRTQVRALRDKTGANGIRQLVQCVLSLPPMVPALRINATPSRHKNSGAWRFV